MESKTISPVRSGDKKKIGPHQIKDDYAGFNGLLAAKITNAVGTMWCAYLFTIIAFIGLPEAIHGGMASFVSWLTQTFLQLVLLSVILVGQKLAARASDKQALQTYRDAEKLIKAQEEVRELVKENRKLIEDIHKILVERNINVP